MSKTIALKETAAPYVVQSARSFELVIPSYFEWLAPEATS